MDTLVAHNPDEIISIVDEDDNEIGTYLRKNHADGRLHRETSVLIVNAENEILVQERADSGMLDYSASGHFPYTENYLGGAIREVEEELGLTIPESAFIKVAKHRVNSVGPCVNNRFITLWEVRGEYKIEDMKIDPKEVKSVQYMSIEKMRNLIENEPKLLSAGFADLVLIYFNWLADKCNK